ncbi:MAG TPA: LemA family protein [Candidatus Saccharimonadales bacterium]|nr:LemA family protein [Candidatus Saccharimonadales bacterium]
MVIAIIVIVVLALGIIWLYNSLVRTKVRVDEAWSDIEVQLKRRYDLIPNLVNSVKGYAAHEKSVFEDVTAARANALSAQTVPEAAQADNQFQAALKSLFAVAENYPQLRASENFQQLSGEITDTEDKIQAARRFYNGAVRDLNTRIKTFPTNIFAGMLGFKQRDFFDVGAGEQAAVNQAPDVQFDADTSADSKPTAKK